MVSPDNGSANGFVVVLILGFIFRPPKPTQSVSVVLDQSLTKMVFEGLKIQPNQNPTSQEQNPAKQKQKPTNQNPLWWVISISANPTTNCRP